VKIKALKDQVLKEVVGGVKFGKSYCHAKDGRRLDSGTPIGPGQGSANRADGKIPQFEVDVENDGCPFPGD